MVAFGPVGEPVFLRTYARELPGGKKEKFEDTIERCLRACNKQLNCNFTKEETEEFRGLLHNMVGSFAGRFLWQLGTGTVDKIGLLSLQNCAGTVVNEPVRPFTWAMSCLLVGAGVGMNIQREYVYEIPKVKPGVSVVRKNTNDADYIVPDSREGWVELLERVLSAFFVTGKSFTYSTVCVRPAGLPIKTFGGISSGAEPLALGIGQIVDLLRSRAGKKLRSVDALDIFNIIESIVISGNVRRSAGIAIGDIDDYLFLEAKRWDLHNIPNYRVYSNNTLNCNDVKLLPQSWWQQFETGGEIYGLFNMRLAREEGRIGDTSRANDKIVCANPCLEQVLEMFETCCLAELFLPRASSYEQLKTTAFYLYRACKHSLSLPCSEPETEEIVHKNMRMGIGVTGYVQASEEQKQWLPRLYAELRQFDEDYSKKNNFPVSVALTTCKPSGTLSKLAGVTEGCNPAEAEYFIQRIRFSSSSDMLPALRDAGYPIEPQQNLDGTVDRFTSVVEFPCAYPGVKTVKNTSAVEQLETVKRIQTEWSDNAVSNTITYSPEEVPAIKEWLFANYKDNIKSVSFLRKMDRNFPQMPREEITKEDYEKRVSVLKGLNFGNTTDSSVDTTLECAGGACPLR